MGAPLSDLAVKILTLAVEVADFSPFQVQTYESFSKTVSTCHNLVQRGYLIQVRQGTRGNPTGLCPYKTALFALCPTKKQL